MNATPLHSPLIRRAVDAINMGTVDDFMALFAPDARVEDGPTYNGLTEIREWASREVFGVAMRLDVVRELNAEGTMVEVKASSNGGYNGVMALAVTVRDGLIERLVIS